MLPACVARRADGATPQGPLLCRGATTLEANTSYARAAEALYGPAYSGGLAAAMVMPTLGATGIQTLGDDHPITATQYRQVTLGPDPAGTDDPVELRALGPHDAQACMGARVTDKVPVYFDATDPRQGQGGAVYCLPQNVRVAPSQTPKRVDPAGVSTAAG